MQIADELRYHLEPPGRALSLGGAALCLGVVIGLWVPRRLIRCRLLADVGNTEPARARVDFEFAAALAGGLILGLALLWAACLGFFAAMEAYRGLWTQHFLHPAELTRLLLIAPAWVGLLGLGALGTTVLVALHGWQRLISRPHTDVGRLWILMLLGGWAGVALVGVPARPVVVTGVLMLATFAAGLIAVARKPGGAADAEVWAAAAWEPGLLAPLAQVAAAGACAALALAYLAGRLPLSSPLSRIGLVLVGALWAGAVSARAALHLERRAYHLTPLVLLTAAAVTAWLVGGMRDDAAVPLAPVALVLGLGGVCVVWTGRRIAQVVGRVQLALAWIGGTTAGAAGLVLVLVSLGAAGPRIPAVGSDGSAAGLSRGAVFGRPIGAPPDQAIRVAATDRLTHPRVPTAWEVDLGGPQWDSVFLAGGNTHGPSWTPAQATRLIRRCRAALRPGGRLVVEAADEALRAAAVAHAVAEAYRVRIETPAEVYEALIVGPDVPAWLDATARLDEATITIEPASSAEQVRAPRG